MFAALKTIFLLITLCIHHSYSDYVNYKDVRVIQAPQNKDIYFGYSLLLLQKSTDPIVVVGAPKQRNGTFTGGTLYKCDLKTNQCQILLQNTGGHYYSTIGNWLGSTIVEETNDLEETNIFTCSPRQITPEGIYYFLKGLCHKINELDGQSVENITLSIESISSYRQSNTFVSFYKNGYGQAGFDLQYLQSEEDPLEYDLVFGAPGFEQWNGAVIIRDYSGEIQTIPERNNFINSTVQDFIGYSVRAGRFNLNKDLWIITGAPRYKNLHGAVMIYKVTSLYSQLLRTINSGEKIGSYFGASLLLEDVNGDGYKDLFVGAPMAGGKTWDEGNVHFYKYDVQKQDFGKKVIITGSSKTGARFGTTMSSLGDIDLDNFHDVAISAPYEDETGAVYIFKGSSKGPVFSEKILPEKFQIQVSVKGFGLGLSQGRDIDGNGHNDFIVGAYKSDKIFIIKTKSILTYKLTINVDSSPNLISNSLPLQYCIVMNWKNSQITSTVQFNTKLDLDSRGHTNDKLQQTIKLVPGRTVCNNVTVNIDDLTDIYEPFYMRLSANVSNGNLIAEGNDVVKSVPFTDCGEDKICKPILSLSAELLTPNITIGLTTEVNVDVNVLNSGEYAYQCSLEIVIPKEIELRNTKNCEKQNISYVCLVSRVLINRKQLSLTFDIGEIKPQDMNLNILFNVKSDGSYVPPPQYQITVPIFLKNDPYIITHSLPENIDYPLEGNQMTITHDFRVGNLGPSPINLKNLNIFMPQIESTHLISQIKASLVKQEEEISPCSLTNATTNFNVDVKNNEIFEDVVNVDCSTFNCLQIICNNNFFLPKSMEISYIIKFTLNVNDFVNIYQQNNKNKIEFTTTATISNTTDTITAYAVTKFYVSNYKLQVPIWVYVVASILGLIIFAIIVMIMYKMNFFSRFYKEKMETEQLLIKNDQNY